MNDQLSCPAYRLPDRYAWFGQRGARGGVLHCTALQEVYSILTACTVQQEPTAPYTHRVLLYRT